MKLAYRAALTLIAFLAGADSALAASPVGLWTVTLLLEPDLTQSFSQTICFKADHTWFLPTIHQFKGSWFQKGDQFRWYGAGGTAVASTTQFVTAQLLTGTFDEFKVTDGSTYRTATATLKFTSAACPSPPPPGAAAAREFSDFGK